MEDLVRHEITPLVKSNFGNIELVIKSMSAVKIEYEKMPLRQ